MLSVTSLHAGLMFFFSFLSSNSPNTCIESQMTSYTHILHVYSVYMYTYVYADYIGYKPGMLELM